MVTNCRGLSGQVGVGPLGSREEIFLPVGGRSEIPPLVEKARIRGFGSGRGEGRMDWGRRRDGGWKRRDGGEKDWSWDGGMEEEKEGWKDGGKDGWRKGRVAGGEEGMEDGKGRIEVG